MNETRWVTDGRDIREASSRLDRAKTHAMSKSSAFQIEQACPLRTTSLAAGYLSAHLLITEAELSDLIQNVAAFARERGFALQAIHVEHPPTAPDAFGALIEQVSTEAITTVLIPSLHHLAAVGSPLGTQEYLEHLIGGRVIITGYAP